MAKMSMKDFEFYTDYAQKMEAKHKREFLQVVQPENILRNYEGLRNNIFDSLGSGETDVDRITINKLFPATNTLLPELYPVNPKWVLTPRGGDEYNEISSKILESAMDYYFYEKNAKDEEQEAILNAWFFGYGCIKQGWRAQLTRSQQKKEQQGFLGSFFSPVQEQEIPDTGDSETFIERDEGPFFISRSPENIILDHNKTFNKGDYLIDIIPMTVQQIVDSPIYKTGKNFMNQFSRGKDARTITLDLYEMWIMKEKGIWIFSFVKDWQTPLRWEQWGDESEGFPFELLALQKEPKVTYPVSHFKVAQRAQKELDYITQIQMKNIDKFRSQTLVNRQIFADEDQARLTLENNDIGGIIYTNRSTTGGDVTPLQSTPIQPEMYAISNLLAENIQSILTITGAKQGESSADTATEAKLENQGNLLRTIGMQDYINDWLVRQGRRLAQMIRQFDTAPKILKIESPDMNTMEGMEDSRYIFVEFGTEGNRPLKDAIDGEFEFTVDFNKALPRDLSVIRKQLTDVLQLAIQLQPVLQQQGKEIDFAKLFEDLAKNFETLSNPSQYIKDIQPQLPQVGGLGAPVPLPNGKGSPSIPNENAIAAGANKVNTGVGGL